MLDALTENTHFQGSPKLSQVGKLREGAVQELQGQKQMFEEEARGVQDEHWSNTQNCTEDGKFACSFQKTLHDGNLTIDRINHLVCEAEVDVKKLIDAVNLKDEREKQGHIEELCEESQRSKESRNQRKSQQSGQESLQGKHSHLGSEIQELPLSLEILPRLPQERNTT